MAYEQPRVPIWREGNKLTDYIKELVRFLRSFTVAAWNADRLKDDEIKAIKALIESSAGGGGITVDDVYPVGRIVELGADVDPNTLYDWQEWEQLKDRFLLGTGGSYALGSMGGEATHTLTVDEMPSHSHDLKLESGSFTESNSVLNWTGSSTSWQLYNGATKTAGGSQPHNNMPPYLAVNMWKRTA